MKLYGVSSIFDNYEIKEFDIIKETELTYVVESSNNSCYKSRYTIRKKDMGNSGYDFKLTYEDALKRKEELIRFEINTNCDKMENLKNRNKVLNDLIDSLEK